MILVTGGCGFIGSHFVAKLIENKYEFLVIDNLSNSSSEIIEKLSSLYGININFIKGDIRNDKILHNIFSKYKIEVVIHFAGLKSVSESEKLPKEYYSTNISGSEKLLSIMDEHNVSKFIFSSSATVYQSSHPLPWHEFLSNKMPDNPYAKSKYIVEDILNKKVKKNNKFKVAVLRYFNPIGSHKSGMIGENYVKKDGNLIPSILNVLDKKEQFLKIYGNDFNTPDGSGIRDFVHVNDLIEGHIKAMQYLDSHDGINTWNLGCGKGYSVFEIIEKFEEHLGYKLPVKITKRRKGDLDKYWADITKAKNELNWEAKESLDSMVKDTLNFFNKSRFN